MSRPNSEWRIRKECPFTTEQIYKSERLGFAHGNTNRPYTGSYTACTYDDKSEIKPLTTCGYRLKYSVWPLFSYMTFLLKDKWTECLHSQETCHHTQLHNTTPRGTTVGCTVRMAAMFVAKDGKLRITKVQWNSLASCPRWISRSMNHKCSLQIFVFEIQDRHAE